MKAARNKSILPPGERARDIIDYYLGNFYFVLLASSRDTFIFEKSEFSLSLIKIPPTRG